MPKSGSMVAGLNLVPFIAGQHSTALENTYVSVVYVALEHAGEKWQ